MLRSTAVFPALMMTVFLACAVRAQAQTASPEERWTYSITPYLWLPSFNGTLRYSRPPGSGSPDVSVNEGSLLDALDAAFMISGEARRGKWSLYGDYIYLKLSTSKSNVSSVDFNAGARVNPFSTTVNTGTESELKGSLLTLAAGYSLADDGASRHDVIAGARYFDVTATTNWRLSATVNGPGAGQTFPATGSVSKSEGLLDAIVGVRGRARLADRWFIPYYADIGAGSSKSTWQALAGVSYVYQWGEVALAYRYLEYDQKDDKLMQNFRFNGPMLGATIRF
jgi:opacity protein-like surface antigen